MPYVHGKIPREGVTPEQKAQIVAEMADTLVRVIDEVDPENWGVAGVLTTEYRMRP